MAMIDRMSWGCATGFTQAPPQWYSGETFWARPQVALTAGSASASQHRPEVKVMQQCRVQQSAAAFRKLCRPAAPLRMQLVYCSAVPHANDDVRLMDKDDDVN